MTCKTGFGFLAAAFLALMLQAPSSAHAQGMMFDWASSPTLDSYKFAGTEPSIDRNVTRSGGYSIKASLDYYTSSTRYRSESRPKVPDVVAGRDYWYGFSVFLPSSHVPDTIAWELVAQWHRIPDEGEASQNPPLSLSTTGGRWGLNNKWDSAAITLNKSYDGSRSYDLGPYERNKWTDWVFHIRWSYGNDGLLQVWKDGELVVNKTGPNCYNDQRMPYFKAGLYKGWKEGQPVNPAITSRVVYHSDFRIAGPEGSYAAVAPGQNAGARPRPPTLLMSP